MTMVLSHSNRRTAGAAVSDLLPQRGRSMIAVKGDWFMNVRDENVLSSFAARLRQSLPHASLWGFGSRVRGDAAAESDLDVCVVVEHLDRSARALIRQIAWEVGFDNDVVITTVKYSRDAFEHGPSSVSPLVRTVLKEGVPA